MLFVCVCVCVCVGGGVEADGLNASSNFILCTVKQWIAYKIKGIVCIIYVCVLCIFIMYIYKYTHTYSIYFEIIYMYIHVYIYIHIINIINKYIKYFFCEIVYLYIYNRHSTHTYL